MPFQGSPLRIRYPSEAGAATPRRTYPHFREREVGMRLRHVAFAKVGQPGVAAKPGTGHDPAWRLQPSRRSSIPPSAHNYEAIRVHEGCRAFGNAFLLPSSCLPAASASLSKRARCRRSHLPQRCGIMENVAATARFHRILIRSAFRLSRAPIARLGATQQRKAEIKKSGFPNRGERRCARHRLVRRRPPRSRIRETERSRPATTEQAGRRAGPTPRRKRARAKSVEWTRRPTPPPS